MKQKTGNDTERIKLRQHNGEYWAAIVALCLSGIIYIVLFILDKCTHLVAWGDNNYYNSVGVVCQIAGAIACCILSILAISFSLRNNECLGIPLHTLYSMRTKQYFNFKWSALISTGLLIASVVGYIFECLPACICAAVSCVLFSVYLICVESPYLSMQEKAILRIVKNIFIGMYDGKIKADDYQTAEFNRVLAALIRNKDLKWLYERLAVAGEQEYNKKLLKDLMDIQVNLASHLDLIESNSQQKQVTDALLDTICAMMRGRFNIVQILGEDIEEYLHELTRILFCLLEHPLSKEKTTKRLAELAIRCPWQPEDNQVNWNLYYSVLMIMIVNQIKNNDLEIIEQIKKELSPYVTVLTSPCMATRIFAMLSFVMYYLVEVNSSVPPDMKNNIRSVIDTSKEEDRIEILSWKAMFHEFNSSFELSFDDFISDFEKAKSYCDYYIETGYMNIETLTCDVALKWYLANLFNCDNKLPISDYESILHASNNSKMTMYLKQLEDSCYSGTDRAFVPSDEFKSMADFYQDSDASLDLFSLVENQTHSFREYVDSLRKKELEDTISDAASISNREIEEHFRPMFEERIHSIAGYSSEIDVSKEKKLYIAIIANRKSQASNFDDWILNWGTNNILRAIRKNSIDKCKRTINAGKSFTDSIRSLVKKDFEFVTSNVQCCQAGITDPGVQQQFAEKVARAKRINNPNYLFTNPTVVLKGGFKFNCELQFLVKDFTPEQISRRVDEYRRTDGQYVYEGAFLTREEVSRIIQETHVLFQIAFSYKVSTKKGAIVSFDLFPKDA